MKTAQHYEDLFDKFTNTKICISQLYLKSKVLNIGGKWGIYGPLQDHWEIGDIGSYGGSKGL